MAAEVLGCCVRVWGVWGRGGRGGAYPDVEVKVLVRYGLDVESDCGDRGDYLADLILLLAFSLFKQANWSPVRSFLPIRNVGQRWSCALFWRKGGKVPLVCTAALSCLHCPVRSRQSCSLELVEYGESRTSPRINIRVSFFAQINPENLEM